MQRAEISSLIESDNPDAFGKGILPIIPVFSRHQRARAAW